MASRRTQNCQASLSLVFTGWLIAFGATALSANEATILTLDGKMHRGALASWNQTSLVVATSDGSVQIPAEELLSVAFADRAIQEDARPMIELVDGTQLVADRYTSSGKVATIGLQLTGALQSTPTSRVHRVEFAPLADKLGSLWQTLDAKDLIGDALVIRKQVDAGGATQLDFLTGVVQDISAQEVSFVWDGDAIDVRLGKVAGVAYYRPSADEPGAPLCWIRTKDGSTLAARTVVQQQGRLHVETVAGLKLKFASDAVAEADYSVGKLHYLSDLEPIAQRWTPYVALPEGASRLAASGLPRYDGAQDGGDLVLEVVGEDGTRRIQSFRKGIALRSSTELVYRVPDEMRLLVAQAGIHPNARAHGHVTLEIYADRSLVWEGEVAGGEPPQSIEASIAGARRLRIVVGYGDNLDYGDQLHLVEARMMR